LNKNGKIVEPHFVKNDVLNILKEYKELTSEEIINLVDNSFKNSEFKLNLAKDKAKGAKISNAVFYVKNKDTVIKFQYDEVCNRLAVCPSKDIKDFAIKELKCLNVGKTEYYCNESFTQLQKKLKANGYKQELVREDRFLNETYENQVVLVC